MDVFIIDDDIKVVKILKRVLESESNINKIYTSTDSKAAVDDIMMHHPDIVIIDLLMPEIDGLNIIKKVKKKYDDTVFIMISQVSAKNLIAKAYQLGVEFFISKPINKIEVTSVVNKVINSMILEKDLESIKKIILPQASSSYVSNNMHQNDSINDIKLILSKIGILGEKGSDEIIKICKYLIDNNCKGFSMNLKDVTSIISDKPNTTEQRIRRSIKKGLVNVANLGIEDYMNTIFTDYSSVLFDFEDVKAEMDYIRGQRPSGGTINVKKFIENLLLLHNC